MMIEGAAVFIGVGFILRIYSRSYRSNAKFLVGATPVNKLKGLGEFLEKRPFSDHTVVIFGTVGSTSTVETNHSKALGVFVEDIASVTYEKMNVVASTLHYETTVLNCKDVPWYLEDGTAQVNVWDYKYAYGFYDILKAYFYVVPVRKHFERLLSMKEIKISDPPNHGCKCCERVLEIGTPLTIVGRAERDKDGVPMIQRVYQVFNERIDLEEVVSEMNSNSVHYGSASLFVTAMGVVLFIASLLQDDD